MKLLMAVEQATRLKLQIPNTKFQTNPKNQSLKIQKPSLARAPAALGIGVSLGFGVWYLGFPLNENFRPR
jgi:hypothetical protein